LPLVLECGGYRRFAFGFLFFLSHVAQKKKESQRQSGGNHRTPKGGRL
jgi:hypothetical protein